MESFEYSKSNYDNNTEEINSYVTEEIINDTETPIKENVTEEIISNTETPIKENKENISLSSSINTKNEKNDKNDDMNNNFSKRQNEKNNNEYSQLFLDNILINEESTNIMNTKEPNESIKDYSDYSIEKITEKLKGFIIVYYHYKIYILFICCRNL